LQFGKTKTTFFGINCEWWNRPHTLGYVCERRWSFCGFHNSYIVGLIILQNVTRYFIVNRLRARLQMNLVSIPFRDERFCFLHNVQTGYGIHAASYPMCTSLFCRCLKRPRRDAHWCQGQEFLELYVYSFKCFVDKITFILKLPNLGGIKTGTVNGQ
jgi:hypothetical protein